jgi:hypothetical protein
MSEHTPGPWRAYQPRITWQIRGPQDEYVMEARYGVRQEADARLIAAAPDMLEALKVALVGAKHESCAFTADDPAPGHHCCDWSETVEVIEAAIAKAEGR